MAGLMQVISGKPAPDARLAILSRKKSAIDGQHMAGHDARRGRGQIQHRGGDIRRLGKFPQRHEVEQLGRHCGVVQSAADEPIGTIRLAASNSLSNLLTSRVVSQYRHTYPKVGIHVNENTSLKVRDALVQEGADIALLSDREAFTGLIKIPLATESLMLIAPPAVGLDISRPVSAKSLTGHNLILTPFPNGLRRAVDDILFRAGKVPTPKVEVDTNGLMINLTQRGAGYCVLPYSGVHDLLIRGEVSAAPIRNVRWGWVIAASRERAMSTAMKKIIDMIIDEAKILIENGTWRTASIVES